MQNETLQKIFEFQLARNKKFACQWVDSGQHWYVCFSAFMCEDTKEPDSAVTSYGGCPSNPVFEEDPTRIYPENCMDVAVENVPISFLSFLYTGSELVAADGSQAIPFEYKDMPKRVYKMISNMLEDKKDLEYSLCVYRKTKTPILRISQGNSTLYMMLAFDDRGEGVTIETKECIYKASQWSDSDKRYNKVERKEKMAIKDADMKNIIEKTLGVTPDKLKFDPEKTGGEIIAEEKAAKSESKAPIYAQMEVKEEVQLEDRSAVASAEVTQTKRTRKKAEVTKVQDLTKLIEQLGGSVPEGMSLEDAQKEIRQLRDLLAVTSRRLANVSLAYIEKNAGAEAKLEAIRKAL